jgi:hypothetical protein
MDDEHRDAANRGAQHLRGLAHDLLAKVGQINRNAVAAAKDPADGS